MTGLFITWNPDPEIFNIGGFGVRWYGLLFALGFVFGYIIIKKMFVRENIPLKELDSLTMYMIVGTVVGARLGHCFFYEPQYYIENPLEILNLRQGGLASHGAAIGIVTSLILFALKFKRNIFWIIDRIVIVVALAGVLIRTGNLINSEIIGSPSDLPWAFVFEQVDKVPRHPNKLIKYLVIRHRYTKHLLIYCFLPLCISCTIKKVGAKKGDCCSEHFCLQFSDSGYLLNSLKKCRLNLSKICRLTWGSGLVFRLFLRGLA